MKRLQDDNEKLKQNEKSLLERLDRFNEIKCEYCGHIMNLGSSHLQQRLSNSFRVLSSNSLLIKVLTFLTIIFLFSVHNKLSLLGQDENDALKGPKDDINFRNEKEISLRTNSFEINEIPPQIQNNSVPTDIEQIEYRNNTRGKTEACCGPKTDLGAPGTKVDTGRAPGPQDEIGGDGQKGEILETSPKSQIPADAPPKNTEVQGAKAIFYEKKTNAPDLRNDHELSEAMQEITCFRSVRAEKADENSYITQMWMQFTNFFRSAPKTSLEGSSKNCFVSLLLFFFLLVFLRD